MRKERTNIYLTPRQKAQLEKRSQEDSVSIAEIVRRAVDAYLAWDDASYRPTQAPNKEGRSHPPHE